MDPRLSETEPPTGQRRCLPKAVRVLAWGATAVVLLVCTAWAAAALYFDVPVSWLRAPLAVSYIVGILAVWGFLKGGWRRAGLTAAAFLVVLAWWLSLRPSNNRDWQPDVAVLAYADIEGNRVTVHNIRNCDYRSETDFDVRYYDKTFDLDRLRSADLYMVYWGSPNMAHTMISFGFEGGDYLCFSVETRKEKGEGYSAVKGLFRRFELIYIAADERDVVRLRTNYRQGEEVYVFRLKASGEHLRVAFLDYIRRLNDLHRSPEWYNALTHNCTTSIRMQRTASDRAPWDWRMLANGHGDELLYEHGLISTNLPLPELKRLAHINARAKAADREADFSRRIRAGVPGM
jgi:hypothetical protein